MKTYLFIISFAILFQNISFSQGWFIERSDSLANWYCTFFTDANTGYTGGFKNFNSYILPLIMKTTDAGLSWSIQTTPVSNTMSYYYNSMYFTNTNTGFIAVSSTIEDGKILKTTNGGINWYEPQLPINVCYLGVFFPDQNTGFACGGLFSFSVALKTTDNGTTWTSMNIPSGNGYMICTYFLNTNTGYIVGNGGTILRTTNGGINWTVLNANTTLHLWGVYFINANTGVVVGGDINCDSNIILRTSNGGSTWNSIPYSYSPCLLWSVQFVSQTTGYAVGWNHQILETTDGGLSWGNQFSPSVSQLYRGVFFTSSNTGYIVGQPGYNSQFGLVLKTTDGGGNFVGVNISSNNIPQQYNLSQNYPNPFNPTTTIEFDIPKTSLAKLIIYDLLGREVKTLVNEELKAGIYKVDFDGSDIGSGVYFYRLITDDFTETKKMILLK